MSKIKAVLFDMDGLMVDTEPIHLQAFNFVFQQFGKYLTEEENAKKYIGISDIDEAKDMVVSFNLPISAPELVKAKKARVKELLISLVPQPGLIDLLKNLKQNGYKTAIASSSPLDIIKRIIQDLRIEEMFDEFTSGEEVKDGKPAPDVYLLAAEKVGVNPSECLVLEDAPRGVQAGKAAGMIVFAIPSQYTRGQDFSMADKVLNSLSEVYSQLKP